MIRPGVCRRDSPKQGDGLGTTEGKKSMRLRLTCLIGILLSVSSFAAGPGNVLVLVNDNSPESKEIAAYYVSKRKIPAKNVFHVKCPNDEFMSMEEYYGQLEKPIKAYLKKAKLVDTIDYIVTTRGLPLKPVGLGSGMSVDSMLAAMDKNVTIDKPQQGVANPYFAKRDHFSHKKYGMYLVTRLDGYTVKDAKALVDRSLAAKPQKGTFLIDCTPQKNDQGGGYKTYNGFMEEAHRLIIAKGYVCYYDDKHEFAGDVKSLMGYFSWGSNDPKYSLAKYKSNQFRPGAIAETAVSTSARTFKRTNDGGQSLIADLVEAGVTGVKGYTSEPTLNAIADPRILFLAYLSGYNLAESFYSASRWICWKDVVLGDPLCCPYK